MTIMMLLMMLLAEMMRVVIVTVLMMLMMVTRVAMLVNPIQHRIVVPSCLFLSFQDREILLSSVALVVLVVRS